MASHIWTRRPGPHSPNSPSASSDHFPGGLRFLFVSIEPSAVQGLKRLVVLVVVFDFLQLGQRAADIAVASHLRAPQQGLNTALDHSRLLENCRG
jgi:hypothetical protein